MKKTQPDFADFSLENKCPLNLSSPRGLLTLMAGVDSTACLPNTALVHSRFVCGPRPRTTRKRSARCGRRLVLFSLSFLAFFLALKACAGESAWRGHLGAWI